MTDEYDRKAANDIHSMWHLKMLEVEKELRDAEGLVLANENVVEESLVRIEILKTRSLIRGDNIDIVYPAERKSSFGVHR